MGGEAAVTEIWVFSFHNRRDSEKASFLTPAPSKNTQKSVFGPLGQKKAEILSVWPRPGRPRYVPRKLKNGMNLVWLTDDELMSLRDWVDAIRPEVDEEAEDWWDRLFHKLGGDLVD